MVRASPMAVACGDGRQWVVDGHCPAFVSLKALFAVAVVDHDHDGIVHVWFGILFVVRYGIFDCELHEGVFTGCGHRGEGLVDVSYGAGAVVLDDGWLHRGFYKRNLSSGCYDSGYRFGRIPWSSA